MNQIIKILNNKVTIKYNEGKDDISISATEVAQILEVKNVSQMLKTIDDEEKELVTILREDGKTNKMWILKEYGLYEVLMQSRKPIAKEFKKEIKKLLKFLRKEYQYSSGADIKQLTQKIKEYEKFLNDSKEVLSLSFIADKYELSYEKLIEILNEKHFLYRKGKNLILYREHKYKKYVKYFRKMDKISMYVTLKGENYIDKLIKEEL